MSQAALDEARGVRLLYLILVGGGALVALVFIMMVTFRGPILQPDSGTNAIAFAMAGVSLTAVAFAALLLRPRVPARPPSMPVSEYWTPASRAPSLLVWIVCENAGIVSALGYLLTGRFVTLVPLAIALLALAWYSPARLADE